MSHDFLCRRKKTQGRRTKRYRQHLGASKAFAKFDFCFFLGLHFFSKNN
jgi:hypothetical protein